MNVLVVGHRGYVGSPLMVALRHRGHHVTGLDAQLYSEDFDPKALIRSNDPEVLDHVMAADAVVWLAAFAHDPLGRIPCDALYQNNCRTPLSYAQRINAEGGRVRFIVPSSLSIYANSPYSKSKWYLEQGLSSLHNFYKFVSICRFGTIGGYYESESFRAHLLLNSMVLGGLLDRRIIVRGPALHRPMLSLSRAVEVLCQAVELGEVEQGQTQTFFDYCLTLEDCAQFVRNSIGPSDPYIEIVHEAAVDGRDYGQRHSFDGTEAVDIRELIEALAHTDLVAVDAAAKKRLQTYYSNIKRLA
jgi:nucleoside-diphosphate-sugar epimerase